MDQLNRILAITDLSAPARHAAERAALTSKQTAAPLELLHVADLAPLDRLRQLLAAGQDDIQRHVLDVACQKLHDLAGALRQRFGTAAATRIEQGSLLGQLAREAAGLADGLLVCGAKGESVVRHLLMGTTALRVLSITTCPVLVVKQAPHEPYRKLLVPVDFSPSSLDAIRHAQLVAPHAEIVLLHVYEIPFEGRLRYASVEPETLNHYRIVARQEATQRLLALRNAAGLAPEICSMLVLHGDPPSRIVEQEQELDCDLTVMGKHGESTLETLLLGSVTKHVLNESQNDVLISA